MEDELDKQQTLDLHTFTERMPTVMLLNVAAFGTTLEQRPDIILDNQSKEDASNP